MELVVAVGQLDPTEDSSRNWEVGLSLVERAAAAGARLVVLPEQTMLAQLPGDPARFAALARQAWAWWPEAVADAARRLDLAIIAGGFAPAPPGAGTGGRDEVGGAGVADLDPGDDTRPLNVLLAVDRSGRRLAQQAKTRLYDAFSYQESAVVRPGPIGAPAPVDLGGVLFGLVNCYELRFPEHSRRLVAGGAQALALSAAWVRGPLKEDHWVTLARARAIENCAYVLAAATRAKDTVGRSMVIDPTGVVVAGLADEARGVAIATLDTCRVETARERAGSLP